jgi:hypothetical protein
MKVRRGLFDKSRAVHSYLVQTPVAHAQMRLKMSRRDSK